MTCRHHIQLRCTHPEAVEAFGDDPSEGICRICTHYDGPARGLGDIVETVARVTGVASVVKTVTKGQCNCAQRREKLNAAVPFKPPLDGDR